MSQQHGEKGANRATDQRTSAQTQHYPLIDRQENLIAASGRTLDQVTLDQAAAGALGSDDLQVSADTLRAQATIAEEAGYEQLAQNLRRAAELTTVPNPELLRMYEQLRPGRSSYAELAALADELENNYAATVTAAFVREAAEVYRRRKLLRRS